MSFMQTSIYGGVFCAVLMLTGCATGAINTRDDTDPYVNVSLAPVNHTDQFLYGYAVNGTFAVGTRAFGWRNPGTCCVRLPRQYRPGLAVDIDYDLTLDNGSKHNWQTKKRVPVEPYDEAGSVYVHFFPGDEIRVVVTNWTPRSIHHPIQFSPETSPRNRQ